MKKYICVEDNQNTGFHVGDTMTAEEWKEWAMGMNDFDEFDEDYQNKFKELPPEEAVKDVANIWDIQIVEYDPSDPTHKELKEQYERSY